MLCIFIVDKLNLPILIGLNFYVILSKVKDRHLIFIRKIQKGQDKISYVYDITK